MKPRDKRFTQTGRVVYDRPIHKWTQKDLDRVLRVVEVDRNDYSQLLRLIDSLTEKMLEALLNLVGIRGQGPTALYLLKALVLRALDILKNTSGTPPTTMQKLREFEQAMDKL